MVLKKFFAIEKKSFAIEKIHRYWKISNINKNLCYIVNIVIWKTVQYW